MKGSVENNVASDRNDYLVGDGLRLQLTINRNVLSITGDGCRVSLGSNSGHLRIIGDGCRVNIGCNVGYVEYNGDGGRIVLGPESLDRSRIKYRGVGGVIEFGQGRQNEKAKTTVRPEIFRGLQANQSDISRCERMCT
ncbi:PREDICTED: uncharacterized protein LOC105368851 [Ceratosolen solmsi marchali]|uniref:Uncharacterized protein LOC105368851 n=1 Tax=Ceratosolen solmsi marchali TaxID=326594 RepID=A0AAJ6YXP0_9HYME|nr:PREDICTED: uncharacterized protein LOC105368851 [Ceratosolen solmsi marchali]